MFTIETMEGKKYLISDKEKAILIDDLEFALKFGGEYLLVQGNSSKTNKIAVFNGRKEKIGYLVGVSASNIAFLIDSVFCVAPIDIKGFIEDYLS